jgi:PAS domain S-box-containing protein
MMDKALLAEIRSYVGFTEADAALLARLQPFARPHFGAIADEFYAVIRMHEGAFRVLQNEEQARRLHASLQLWLGELLGGPHDDAYFERRVRNGQVHVRVGLEPRYVIAAMSRIRAALQRVAAHVFAEDRETSDAARLAVARVCDLDLAIMLESYKNDLVSRIERSGARETAPVAPQVDGSRRLFSDALEAADVVLFAFDSNARLVVANRTAEQLTGYAFDELADSNAFVLLFGDRASAVQARWFEASDGSPIEMEADLRTRAGKTRAVRWNVTAQRRVDGGPSVVVVGVDLTNERELERRARQNERLAATGALAAGLAHEIRNPLNGANLHVSVLDRALARSRDVPLEAHEATGVLRAEIKRLGALVTDFLEVARPRPLARVDCDVNEIARAVGALLGREAEAHTKNLAIETCPFPATAKVDVERVKQVIANLVRNGLDAVGEGGRVVVRVRRFPHHVEIDVADDGCGVPDPTAPIFDAFYTTKERGTGLGLSVVHRIVSDHGGDVRFESSPGSTVFTVSIPAEALAGGAERTEE